MSYISGLTDAFWFGSLCAPASENSVKSAVRGFVCGRLSESAMTILGWAILVSGWLLVLAALMLLPPGIPRNAFVLAALGVEALGLGLVARAHLNPKADRG